MSQFIQHIWRVNKRFPLSWRKWGDQIVVYHPGTGDTHLLPAEAFQILERVINKPATIAELANEFAHLSDNQQDIINEISSLLTQWELVDLIERVEASDTF